MRHFSPSTPFKLSQTSTCSTVSNNLGLSAIESEPRTQRTALERIVSSDAVKLPGGLRELLREADSRAYRIRKGANSLPSMVGGRCVRYSYVGSPKTHSLQ